MDRAEARMERGPILRLALEIWFVWYAILCHGKADTFL
jgi:hypothetical protein